MPRTDGNSRFAHERLLQNAVIDAAGALAPGMMGDGLRLTLAGYEVWPDGLTPRLTELPGARAAVDLAPPPTGNPAAR